MTSIGEGGPWLVTVYADGLGEKVASRVASRRAFATLAGASGRADDVVARYFYAEYPEDLGKELPPEYFELSTAARDMTAEGVTITLPDGTVIEVELVPEDWLRRDLRVATGSWPAPVLRDALCADWNAAFNAAEEGR